MKRSAGILLYRLRNHEPEFFLVHPGGPFWEGKDTGAWSVPKGEFEPEEPPLEAAKREFREETGLEISVDKALALEPVTMKSGKVIYAWAVEGDMDPGKISSNLFEITFKNGTVASYPEIDRAGWFDIRDAVIKINPAQVAFIVELGNRLIKKK